MQEGGGLYKLAVDRPVTVLMIVLGIMVFGLVSLSKIPLSLMPELNHPTITVKTTYEGAAPEEVENNITVPLEEALGVVSRLRRMESISRTDESTVLLEFGWDTDMNLATQDVSEKIERVFLPDGAERPLILRYDPTLDPVMRIDLYGADDLLALREYAEQDLKRELEKIPGVAAVKVRGGLDEEIRVFLDEEKLSLARLDIEALNRALAAQNINLAGGTLKEGSTEYIVRTVNEFRSLDEIADSVVGTQGGIPIRIRDIGSVERSWKDREMITRVNDGESVELDIYKEADANMVTLSGTLRRRIFGREDTDRMTAEAKKEEEDEGGKKGPEGPPRGRFGRKPLVDSLPQGVKLHIVSDQAAFVKLSIDNLKNAVMGGGFLAVLILFFFLKRFGPTIIVGLTIPLSVIATFAAMYIQGVTLNIMSLGGLALGVGMLMDNAIVVLESIARCREEGDPPRRAALRGVREVGMAVTASTLTTVAVFFPIVFVEGIAGQVFRDLSLTVVFALLASLAMSLFFIPMLSAIEWKAKPRTGEGPLWRDLIIPKRLARVREKVRSAKGLFGKSVQILNAPFVLAMGESLWPAEAAPRRSVDDEGRPKGGILAFLGILVRGPAWILFRPVMGIIGLFTWAFFSLLRLSYALGETILLWILGIGAFVLNKILALPIRLFERCFAAVTGSFSGMLDGGLKRPARVTATMGLAFALLVGFGYLLDMELIPRLHNRTLEVEARMPVGTPLERTDAVLLAAMEKILELPEITEAALQSGVAKDDLTRNEGGEYSARMTVSLTREGSLEDVERRAVEGLRKVLGEIPDLTSKIRFPSLFTTRTPVEVEVYSTDLRRLMELSGEAHAALLGVEGLTDVQSSLSRGNPEIQIHYDRRRLAQYGLDIATVASRIRTKVLGQVQTRFDKGREKVDIRIQLRPEDRVTVEDLGRLVVNPGTGHPVPLSAVAELRMGHGPSEIRRLDQRRGAVISANVQGFGLLTVSRSIQGALSRLDWGEEEGFVIGGQKEEMDRSSRSLILALALSIFLVYLVMASQFESMLHPFLIMFTIPLAFLGVFFVLLALNIPLSILVFIGMIMLAGIVVNNAIVFVDYVNQLRERGRTLTAALKEAAAVRMRPIFMTTLTTLFGLLPLALGLGAGAELQVPMAVTVMAGLAFATLLTLIVIPTLYFIVERRREDRRGAAGKEGGEA